MSLRIVVLGLSITSAWGNGHATTYRGLVRALVERGHSVLFLERDVPWYAANRDMPHPPWGETALYGSVEELGERFAGAVRAADVVMVGSYVPDGAAVGAWVTSVAQGVTAFYDIDTPATLAALARDACTYLAPELIARYALYLSFSGGPTLEYIASRYGARLVHPLYCAVDPELYFPEQRKHRFCLGYMGTYSVDRQPALDALLLTPARLLADERFVVAGPQYPHDIAWPANVERIEHLSPAEHRPFYTAQRYALNVTRADMVQAGYAPSVRLFEAAACATPVISDWWEGLDTFFAPGDEILVARSAEDTMRLLQTISEAERRAIGEAARARVLAAHTAAHRAVELEGYLHEAKA